MTASLNILWHNVYWLQGHPYHPKQMPPLPPEPAILEALATMYQQHQPDVVACEELQTPAAAEALITAVDPSMSHAYTPGNDHADYGAVIGWRDVHTGAVDDWQAPPASVDVKPMRVWQRLKLQSSTAPPLSIVHVHLPSNRMPQDATHPRQRLSEVRSLLSLQPDILLGDHNATPSSGVAHHLREAGYDEVGQLAGQPDAGTNMGGRRIDLAWIRRDSPWRIRRLEVIDLKQDEHRPTMPHKQTLSDHFPSVIEIEA